jgi:8-oxo-dGTP diphosphatase
MKPRAAVILIRNDTIALIERHRAGRHYFVFPGGKIKPHETPAAAAAREALEELGLELEIGRMVAEVWYLGVPQYYFLSEAIGGQFGLGMGKEMNNRPGSEKGTYYPTWMQVKEINQQPILPKLMAEYVAKCYHAGWPESVLLVTNLPPDEPG